VDHLFLGIVASFELVPEAFEGEAICLQEMGGDFFDGTKNLAVVGDCGEGWKRGFWRLGLLWE
jgi:hypothetical protein